MDRSDVLTLVSQSYTPDHTDELGQLIPVEEKREVFCSVGSVSFAEWSEGGRQGLRPELRATMFLYDYNGEDTAIYRDCRYAVYRTYIGKNDTIELYLERRAGS